MTEASEQKQRHQDAIAFFHTHIWKSSVSHCNYTHAHVHGWNSSSSRRNIFLKRPAADGSCSGNVESVKSQDLLRKSRRGWEGKHGWLPVPDYTPSVQFSRLSVTPQKWILIIHFHIYAALSKPHDAFIHVSGEHPESTTGNAVTAVHLHQDHHLVLFKRSTKGNNSNSQWSAHCRVLCTIENTWKYSVTFCKCSYPAWQEARAALLSVSDEAPQPIWSMQNNTPIIKHTDCIQRMDAVTSHTRPAGFLELWPYLGLNDQQRPEASPNTQTHIN